ncbi:MAG: Lpg1974 family pore-forming outer membrane protein [Azospirillaceae bacterium]
MTSIKTWALASAATSGLLAMHGQAAAQTSPTGIALGDEGSTISFMGTYFLDYLGVAPDAFIGEGIQPSEDEDGFGIDLSFLRQTMTGVTYGAHIGYRNGTGGSEFAIAEGGDTLSFNFDGDFNQFVLDGDIGQVIDLGSGIGLRLYGGLRFSWIDLDQTVTVLKNGGADGSRQSLNVTTYGIGPRIGAEMRAPLGDGFFFDAETSLAGLVGFRDTSISFTKFGGPGGTKGFDLPDDTTFIGNAEASAGFGARFDGIEVVVGYRIEHWSDVIGTSFSKTGSDVTGHGPFFEVTVPLN